MPGIKLGPESEAVQPIAKPIAAEPIRELSLGRRGFLKGVTALFGGAALMAGADALAGSTAVAAPLETPKAAGPLESDAGPGATARIRIIAERKYSVDQLGYRVTNAWKAADGFNMLGYQGVVLQEDPTTGEVRLWNTLDEMNKAGLDAKLDNGSLGVTVPPYEKVDDKSGGDIEVAFRNRVAMFGVPSDVVAFANNYRLSGLEVGVFTSRGKSYGDYEVWRMQRIAVQRWKDGRIQRILVGDAAKAVGIVPQEVQLANADLGFGKFDSQPPIPQPSTPEPPKPAPEAPAVNLPPLPPGGMTSERMQEWLGQINWEYRPNDNAVISTGKTAGWRQENGKLILRVSTNKSNPAEIQILEFAPSSNEPLVFRVGRGRSTSDIYKAADVESAYQAAITYVPPGDAIQTLRKTNSIPNNQGYFQSITSWR